MSIKSIIVRELLTTDKSYSEIVDTVRAEVGDHVQTSVKCVAFYACRLRKIDPDCLGHRSKSKSNESLTDLISKYKQSS